MVSAIQAMKLLCGQKILFIFGVAVFWGTALRANLEVTGVTTFRAVTTNLDGAGIRVAQPEGYVDGNPQAWEITPAIVGQPGSRFTYTSALGTTNVYPNSLGTNSWHAEAVGQALYGIPFGVATNVARVDSYEAEYFITSIVGTLTAISDPIVNQSFSDSLASQSYYDPIYDNYAAQYGTLFISGAGNSAGRPTEPPSTCYNGISVAAFGPGNVSCVGPTADGRCKPELTVPNPYTSFSTPYVSGAAAVLLQAGLRGDGGPKTNLAADVRTMKALLLNGAVKPLGWTNDSSKPLDARHGAGMLNIVNAYYQLAGGKQGSIVSNLVTAGAAHPPTSDPGTVPVLSGWDFGTNTSASGPSRDAIHHYYFNVTNNLSGAKFTATATLVWNRHQNKTGINNLNLFLYNCANSNLVLCSTSLVDNVEHIYKTNLAQGRYDLQVWKAGGATVVSASETYALAFEFFADTLGITKSGTNTMLTWPVYPAGFLVEGTTNLISPNWTTNNLAPASITNNLNTLPLNATNGNQFFRLRRPNF